MSTTLRTTLLVHHLEDGALARAEGLHHAPLARRHGTPLLADVGPLSWAAGPAVPVEDVDALARALRPLGDPAVRTRLGAAAA